MNETSSLLKYCGKILVNTLKRRKYILLLKVYEKCPGNFIKIIGLQTKTKVFPIKAFEIKKVFKRKYFPMKLFLTDSINLR